MTEDCEATCEKLRAAQRRLEVVNRRLVRDEVVMELKDRVIHLLRKSNSALTDAIRILAGCPDDSDDSP